MFDKKIKKTFRLFQGLRPEKEDKKIYDKVSDLCFQETIAFLEESLDFSRQAFLTAELEKIDEKKLKKEEKSQQALETIFKYLTAIPHYRFRLNKRLDYFLNQLLYDALKNDRK